MIIPFYIMYNFISILYDAKWRLLATPFSNIRPHIKGSEHRTSGSRILPAGNFVRILQHLFYHRGHIRRVGGCVSVAICFHFVQGVRQLPQTQKYYPVFLSVAIQEIRRRNQVNYHSRKSRHIIFLGLMRMLIFVPCPFRSMFVGIGRNCLYYSFAIKFNYLY